MTARRMKKIKMTAATALTLLIALAVVFPVLYGALGAFKSEAEFYAYPPTVFPQSLFYLDNFTEVVRQVPLMRYFLNSFVIASVGALVGTGEGRGAAFLIVVAGLLLSLISLSIYASPSVRALEN